MSLLRTQTQTFSQDTFSCIFVPFRGQKNSPILKNPRPSVFIRGKKIRAESPSRKATGCRCYELRPKPFPRIPFCAFSCIFVAKKILPFSKIRGHPCSSVVKKSGPKALPEKRQDVAATNSDRNLFPGYLFVSLRAFSWPKKILPFSKNPCSSVVYDRQKWSFRKS
jgi:hypothetical protein